MLRAINKVKSQITKLDYLTVMSHKHAHNLVCNEDKMISLSLKEQANIYNKQSLKIHKNDDIEWLTKMSIDHANNKYN